MKTYGDPRPFRDDELMYLRRISDALADKAEAVNSALRYTDERPQLREPPLDAALAKARGL